jgi:hypothetical protein
MRSSMRTRWLDKWLDKVAGVGNLVPGPISSDPSRHTTIPLALPVLCCSYSSISSIATGSPNKMAPDRPAWIVKDLAELLGFGMLLSSP